MGPEIWVGLAAVFVAGGAVGAAGTLLSQWLVRKLGGEHTPPRDTLRDREVSALRADVAEMSLQLHNLDARLDFQEQLLGGATPLVQAPPRRVAPDAEAETRTEGGQPADPR
jgi:hypothetical protein